MSDLGSLPCEAEGKWDNLWESTVLPVWDEMSEELLKVLLHEMPDMTGKQVLECGCGTGRVSMRLVRFGASVTLLDKSAAALKLASRFSQQQRLSVELVEGDIFSMPFSDSRFDLVWNAGVLEHFERAEQVKILKEMKRVCKPDGLVIVVVPYAGNPLYRVAKWWKEKTGRWVFGKEKPVMTLVDILESAGLQARREYTADFSDSINMLAGIPGSETLQTLFRVWCDILDPAEKAALPGRWLVAVAGMNGEPQPRSVKAAVITPAGGASDRPSVAPSLPIEERVPIRSTTSDVAPAPVSKGLPPIVCFSSIRWDELYQRPQHIMTRLANYGHKVLFVEPAFREVRIQSSHISTENLKVIIDNSVAQSLRRIGKGLYALNPLSHVQYGGCDDSGASNKRDTMLASILAACDLLDIKDPVFWVLTPHWYKVLEQLPLSLPVVYDCVDDHRYFAGSNPAVIGHLDELLTKRANVVLATAKRLYRNKAQYANAIFLPNGVDFEAFQRESISPPEDLKSIPRPRLGFSGAVSTWVDVDLLYELARKRPEWHIVVVGSVYVDVSRLLALGNFHYLGKKDHASLPAYLKGFDVGLIPFKSDHPLVTSSNPIKLYEYLACGVPVVSTRWEEIAEFEDVVSFAQGPEEFLSAVEEVLRNPPSAERLSARASAFDWNAIAQVASHAILLAKADANGDGGSMERVLRDIEELKSAIVGGPAPYPQGLDSLKAYARVLSDDPDEVIGFLKYQYEDKTPDRICELGNRLYLRGLNSRAIHLFERGLTEYPGDSDLMYNLALLLVERNRDGDRSRAEELLRRIVEHRPEDKDARVLLESIASRDSHGADGGIFRDYHTPISPANLPDAVVSCGPVPDYHTLISPANPVNIKKTNAQPFLGLSSMQVGETQALDGQGFKKKSDR